MSLKVVCPKGCRIRIPSRRADSVIRCPQCRAIIRIPESDLDSRNNSKPLVAKLIGEPPSSSARKSTEAKRLREEWRSEDAAKEVSNVDNLDVDDLSTKTPESPAADSDTEAFPPRPKSTRRKESRKADSPKPTKASTPRNKPASPKHRPDKSGKSKSPAQDSPILAESVDAPPVPPPLFISDDEIGAPESTPKASPDHSSASGISSKPVGPSQEKSEPAPKDAVAKSDVPAGRQDDITFIDPNDVARPSQPVFQPEPPAPPAPDKAEPSSASNDMAIVEPPVESPPISLSLPASDTALPAPRENMADDVKRMPASPTAVKSDSLPDAEPKKSTLAEPSANGEASTSGAGPKEKQATVGIVPDESKCFAARALSIILVLAGLFTMGPAIYQLVVWFQGTQVVDIDRWVFVLFFLAGIHFLYASYLVHLPDWSAVWVVSFLMLVMACLDALCLAGILLGDASGPVAQALQISMVLRSKSMIWILCMLSVHGLLCYFCGREAIRWKRTFDVTVSLLD